MCARLLYKVSTVNETEQAFTAELLLFIIFFSVVIDKTLHMQILDLR